MTEQEFFQWRKAHGFKSYPWAFGATIRTPLDRLDWFVDTLLAPLHSIREAVVRVTQVVFEPKALNAFRTFHGVEGLVVETPAHSVTSILVLRDLLKAAFSDWLDFGVFISPALFALAADHDEWTRIVAVRKSKLARVISPLMAGGIQVVEPPHRFHELPRDRPTL